MSKYHIQWVKQANHINILLIGRPASNLATYLQEAPGRYGSLSISIHSESRLIRACAPYDCYVIDADFLGNIEPVMCNILSKHPDARILVVSDKYNWQDAVHAFRLGAINVVRTPSGSIMTRNLLTYALKQQLPRQAFYRNDASV